MEVRHWNPGDSLFYYNEKKHEFGVVKLQEFKYFSTENWPNFENVPTLTINDKEYKVEVEQLFDSYCYTDNHSLLLAFSLSNLLDGIIKWGIDCENILDSLMNFIIENKLC